MPIIVTAYYKTKNKYDNGGDLYLEWMKNFIPYVEKFLLIFVENKQEFLDYIMGGNIVIKNNIEIIEKPMKSFSISHYDWDSQHIIDPEKNIHNTNLYKIWNEKINFLKIATEIYPTNNDYYIWTDIGMFRDKILRPFVRYYPDRVIDRDKVYFLRVRKHNIEYSNNIIDVSTILAHISAAAIYGYKSVIEIYHKKYYEMVEEFFEKKIFAGKEQNIMFNMTLKYPDLIKLIDHTPNNWMQSFQSNIWFYSINYLIVEKKFIVCAPVYAGLANLLFNVFSSYGYAVKTNRVFFLTKNAVSSHSGINYTDTLFNHFCTIDEKKIKNIEIRNEKKFDTFMGLDIYPEKNYKLQKWLQNEKYFDSERHDIIKMFDSLYITNEFKYDYFIHCRRGDYLSDSFHNIDLTLYFDRAIEYIKTQDNMWTARQFCILSDDINWCEEKQFLGNHNLNITYIKNKNELDTLKIMASTNFGGVGSNSTYSWWGLWLNKNLNTHLILPSKWSSDTQPSNIYFKGCHIISIN